MELVTSNTHCILHHYFKHIDHFYDLLYEHYTTMMNERIKELPPYSEIPTPPTQILYPSPLTPEQTTIQQEQQTTSTSQLELPTTSTSQQQQQAGPPNVPKRSKKNAKKKSRTQEIVPKEKLYRKCKDFEKNG